jgi:hypothetical protein
MITSGNALRTGEGLRAGSGRGPRYLAAPNAAGDTAPGRTAAAWSAGPECNGSAPAVRIVGENFCVRPQGGNDRRLPPPTGTSMHRSRWPRGAKTSSLVKEEVHLKHVDPTAPTTPQLPIPTCLAVGDVMALEICGEAVLVVGSYPSGLPVIVSRQGWRTLQACKLTKLSTSSGRVVACGVGVQQPAARLLAGIAYERSKGVVYRNGNTLDLRPSNLLVWPWSRIRRERSRYAAEHPSPERL